MGLDMARSTRGATLTGPGIMSKVSSISMRSLLLWGLLISGGLYKTSFYTLRCRPAMPGTGRQVSILPNPVAQKSNRIPIMRVSAADLALHGRLQLAHGCIPPNFGQY